MKGIATLKPILTVLLICVHDVEALGKPSFVSTRSCLVKSSTTLGISKELAKKLDENYYYQEHKKEIDEDFQNRILGYLDTHLPLGLDAVDLDADTITPTQRVRDTKLAMKDMSRYCRDRCLATGFCDVFEEAYDYSQEEARAFCTECVVAVDEDGDEHLCDLPEGSIEQYYEDLLKENRKKGLRL
uniref:Apple domain-containing protein n=2 Tax=Corethron hystrix TaxID=216773 RepID=A0A7S1G0I8_9STRA|mmetsp:Transcript_4693/g.9219  ORF Transcript_4693/g.9219 Transcript_4693/m.9219 type:complete len:186 (+) Transcript_4693:331-888(+)|eukprot:CAMPEP_0113306586 /NCGR_PEP_ID=MMETSP0010_2-20120614/5778_1 /TAXON_ID=216773 ORGANISM="Corethron hystrix, Strain 308" /NCGR_SAMPLE_ID=MMETSP0010_2 /ASSEMBLY_ACC=CAM_ASM_000155 /LENGTH=185 /DNA_ID=CAMNT_0000161283 /DNA_START=328 /DNA_END=885 /DNA_ORIENTATION=+ /assembly_acc=CAM_ASM_000155